MIYLFKTNVLRNSNTEIKGKLSLRSSYSCLLYTSSQMLSVRKKLSEYKLNKTVNTAYANMNKNNLNIFSRKV